MQRRGYRQRDDEFKDRVIYINRVTKVVAGGKRLRFAALVVVGDEKGRVGFGQGKAKEVPLAIQKAVQKAKKNLIRVPIVGTTIPYEVIGRHDAGKVLLKPASRGTGVIAGGPVRTVMELAGIQDVLTKSMRSNNHFAVIRATFDALLQLRSPQQIAEMRKIPLRRFYREPFPEVRQLEKTAESPEKAEPDATESVSHVPDESQAQPVADEPGNPSVSGETKEPAAGTDDAETA